MGFALALADAARVVVGVVDAMFMASERRLCGFEMVS